MARSCISRLLAYFVVIQDTTMAKQNFKEVSTEAAAILSQIREGKYSPVYLLMGDDEYYIDLISTYISTNILTREEREFNQITLYGKDVDAGAVISQARRYPMMSQYQVVIVREAQAMGNFDILSHYFAAPAHSTILVLCYKGKSVDKRSTLYKAAVKVATVLETVTPRDYEISNWIIELLKTKGCTIEPKAVQMITEHIGANLSKINSEMDKLLTRLPQGTASITPLHIEQNIGISKDFNNFELTKALSSRNFRQALVIAEHLSSNVKENPIQVTISLLFTHFQRIVTYNIYKWECSKRGIQLGSDYDVAKLLKLQSAYFVSEYVTASASYPGAKASKIISLIREWDMKSKGMNAGSGQSDQLLKELILRISAA